MVESKFIVLQMIPHTLFIEWDFKHYFTALFTSRWHCSLVVLKSLFIYMYCSYIYIYIYIYICTVHIYGTVHMTSFFLQMFIFRFI